MARQSSDRLERPPGPALSSAEKADILLATVQILMSGIFGLFTALFRGSGGAPGYLTHAIHNLLRQLSRLSVAQFQYLDRHTSTDLVYSQFMARAGFASNSITLVDGTNCHWIGPVGAKRVLLYFPGSFVLPSSRFHLQFAANCAEKLNHEGRDAAVLVVSTGLAPAYQYPRQLIQVATALKYLLEETGRNPSEIALVGDSTGGNLALALLSHISHPHPDVPPLELHENLQGVILASPIVDFDAITASTKENSRKDHLHQSSIPTWGDNYVSYRDRDNYINPGLAPENWWKGAKVQNAIALYGEYELPRDSIEAWVTKFKTCNPATKIALGRGEFHAQPVMDLMRNSKVASSQARALGAWLVECLWS